MASPHQTDGPPDGPILLSIKQVLKKVPVSRQTIYNWEKVGDFPRRINPGGRTFWLLSEVDAWIAAQVAKRDAANPAARPEAAE